MATCKERYIQENPQANIEFVILGSCPHKYLEDPDWCMGCNPDVCHKCWDREIPEDEVFENQCDTCKYSDGVMCSLGKPCVSHGSWEPKDETPHILDSGTRREFDTGAVRDIQEGKGRCDLLPLDVVAEYMNDAVLGYIANFTEDGNPDELFDSLSSFVADRYDPRSRTQWTDCDMLLEVSKHFEEGAKKYGESNWQKGIPVHCYIDSAVRHYLKFLRGDKDEPHDRAFCWNILCAIWTCKHKPELNGYGEGKGREGQGT